MFTLLDRVRQNLGRPARHKQALLVSPSRKRRRYGIPPRSPTRTGLGRFDPSLRLANDDPFLPTKEKP
jgi:hypothetical protein